jgi:hypothetical protein
MKVAQHREVALGHIVSWHGLVQGSFYPLWQQPEGSQNPSSETIAGAPNGQRRRT